MQIFLESGVSNKLEKMNMICESLMTGIIIIIIQHVRSNAIFDLTAVVKKNSLCCSKPVRVCRYRVVCGDISNGLLTA